MSTLTYAALTEKRLESEPNESTKGAGPGVSTYVDTLAALVPAEVLTAHAAILTFTCKTQATSGETTTTITEPDTLRLCFWLLLFLSIAIYAVGRALARSWDKWDFVRMLIPPLAFVCWTMVQRSTAFEALHLPISDPPRRSVAIIGALVLAFVCWTMVQRSTAFDALQLPISDPTRSAVAIIGALVLGFGATVLAYQADQRRPPPQVVPRTPAAPTGKAIKPPPNPPS
jgi:hypothetical protein